MVLEADLDAVVVGEVRALERVGRERRRGDREEALRVFDHPARVDAHVVGDHVAGEADPACGGTIAEPAMGLVAAEICGDPVVVE